MREMTVRIRFSQPSLGNVRVPPDGRFLLPRGPDGRVVFLTSWHRANMRFAAQVCGMREAEAMRVQWDPHPEVVLGAERWFRRMLPGDGRPRHALHEAVQVGAEMSINVVLPAKLTDADFLLLMETAGRYRGLSPWKPGEFGTFAVVGLAARRPAEESP